MKDEEEQSQGFVSKQRDLLTKTTIVFNGLEITVKDGVGLSIAQKRIIEKLKTPSIKSEWKSERTLAQYNGMNCRPEMSAAVQLIALKKKMTTKPQYTSSKRTFGHLKKDQCTRTGFCKNLLGFNTSSRIIRFIFRKRT